MFKLSISTNEKKPDTTLTQRNIDSLSMELDEETDRDTIAGIIQKIMDAQINQYQLRELNDLKSILYNPKYKLREIVSTLHGLLMRLEPSPTVGGRRKKARKGTRKSKKAGRKTRKH